MFLHSHMTLSSVFHIMFSFVLTLIVAVYMKPLDTVVSLVVLVLVFGCHVFEVIFCIKARSLPSNLREFAFFYGKVETM